MILYLCYCLNIWYNSITLKLLYMLIISPLLLIVILLSIFTVPLAILKLAQKESNTSQNARYTHIFVANIIATVLVVFVSLYIDEYLGLLTYPITMYALLQYLYRLYWQRTLVIVSGSIVLQILVIFIFYYPYFFNTVFPSLISLPIS